MLEGRANRICWKTIQCEREESGPQGLISLINWYNTGGINLDGQGCAWELSFGQVKTEKSVMHRIRFQVDIWANKSGVVAKPGLEIEIWKLLV